jgi:hypothetical protein
MNLTKNASCPTSYYMKERKLNFIAVFADKSVTTTEKQKQITVIHNRLKKRDTFCIVTVINVKTQNNTWT